MLGLLWLHIMFCHDPLYTGWTAVYGSLPSADMRTFSLFYLIALVTKVMLNSSPYVIVIFELLLQVKCFTALKNDISEAWIFKTSYFCWVHIVLPKVIVRTPMIEWNLSCVSLFNYCFLVRHEYLNLCSFC